MKRLYNVVRQQNLNTLATLLDTRNGSSEKKHKIISKCIRQRTIMQGMVAREKKQRKAKTTMGERHHRYIWYDSSSKQSGGGQASILQRHLGSDQKKNPALVEQV